MAKKQRISPKKLKEMVESACAKLQIKGDEPEWKDHPPNLNLILFATNELPLTIKKSVEEHLKSCFACKDVLQKIKKDLSGAKTQKEALKIMWKWLEEKK